ncbi:hypothetical protein Tco_0125126, partial [Tanacetum coccineum]
FETSTGNPIKKTLLKLNLPDHRKLKDGGEVTQEIEDTHVTVISVNPDGQQQSSSISSGFVSNMLNLNQDIGVDAIFRHNAEATSLVDIPITARAEPSFFA